MPSPFEALLLGLAAWRTWHLLAEDDITEPLRRYVTDGRSEAWDDFLECPFCLGFWVAVGWVAAFAVWPAGVVWGALLGAVAAAPPLVNWWMSDRSG